MISDCLFYYFSTIREVLGKYWEYNNQIKPQNILQSTVGFEALMNLLSDILQYDNNLNTEFSIQKFLPYISRLEKICFDDVERFPIATKGKAILYKTMYQTIFEEN